MSKQFIVRITAEQFKNVKVIDFMPNRYVTQISGANGAGKTSALDAVFYGLLGRKTLPANLLRQGQKKGFIRIETNTHIITRHLNEKGGTLEIEVKGANTLEKAPDNWLKGIAGPLGFDPLQFMRMKPEDQAKALKELVPMDVDVDDLRTRNDNDDAKITERRRSAKKLEAARESVFINNMLPAEPTNIDELLAKAREASEHNAGIEREDRRRRQIMDNAAHLEQTIAQKTKMLENLQSEISNLAAEAKQTSITIKEWKPLEEPQDRAAIDEQISQATRTNNAIITNNANKRQRQDFDRDLLTLKDEISALEETVRDRKIKMASALENAKFPIAGLGYETVLEGAQGQKLKHPETTVTYKGLPLSEASSAEQIRVSTAIGMAGRTGLRFLLIREGSLLDDSGMAILEQMAHENDFQILMEKVDTSGKIGIYMEDGTIKTVNPEEEAKPEPTPKKTPRSRDKTQGELIQ